MMLKNDAFLLDITISASYVELSAYNKSQKGRHCFRPGNDWGKWSNQRWMAPPITTVSSVARLQSPVDVKLEARSLSSNSWLCINRFQTKSAQLPQFGKTMSHDRDEAPLHGLIPNVPGWFVGWLIGWFVVPWGLAGAASQDLMNDKQQRMTTVDNTWAKYW